MFPPPKKMTLSLMVFTCGRCATYIRTSYYEDMRTTLGSIANATADSLTRDALNHITSDWSNRINIHCI